MRFTANKPKGTFYTDYTIDKGFLFGIFEHDSRQTFVRMAHTTLKNSDWKRVKVSETDSQLIIDLSDGEACALLKDVV